MKFSVITPTYNRATYITEAIHSIRKQTVKDWEHIIVDDGSTDQTATVIKKLQNSTSRIRYIQQSNQGAQVARNRGLTEAKGDIIVYLDSDDRARPTLLAHIAKTINRSPLTIFGIPNHLRQKILLNKTGAVKKALPSQVAHDHPVSLVDIYHWSSHTTSSGLFHKRNGVQNILQWDPAISRFQDWDFLMQLGKTFSQGFSYIPEVLIEYYERYGGNGMCATASYADWATGFETIYQKHKHDSLMHGQTWHPRLVHKYTKLQANFVAGKVQAPQDRYFI